MNLQDAISKARDQSKADVQPLYVVESVFNAGEYHITGWINPRSVAAFDGGKTIFNRHSARTADGRII